MRKAVHGEGDIQSGRESKNKTNNETRHQAFIPKVPWYPDWDEDIQQQKKWNEDSEIVQQ